MRERTIEQLMDCIILVGKRIWLEVPASVIVCQVLSDFRERIGLEVTLTAIEEDVTFDYICLEYPTIREALDQIAQYTGTVMRVQDAQVSFVKREEKQA